MLDYNESRVYGETKEGDISAVVLAFETDYVPHPKTKETGPRDKVILGKRGDPGFRAEHWIDRLSNDGHSDDPMLWNLLIKPRYEAWKKGEEIIGDGTPLAALPFVHKRQAETWRQLHIYTAEDLAKTEDGDLHRLGMDARKARDLARKFLETKNSGFEKLTAELERSREREVARDAEMEEMRRMLADLTKPQPPTQPTRKAA